MQEPPTLRLMRVFERRNGDGFSACLPGLGYMYVPDVTTDQ